MAGETRRKVVVYLLYNRNDIRENAKHISKDVRDFYNNYGCVKNMLFKHFSSGHGELDSSDKWCCNFHS